MSNFFFNKLSVQRVHDSFYHDEELGRYISEEFSLSIPDDFSENILYKGRRVKYTRTNSILYIVLGQELVAVNVLLQVITGPVPDYLMDAEIGDTEAVPYQTNQRAFEKDAYYLRNQNVDIYDSNTDTFHYNVTKGFAVELLDCRRSLVYDLVAQQYNGKVGYKGYFVRSHVPGKFELTEDVMDNDSLADTAGIYLMTHMDADTDEVIVTGDMQGIIDTIAQDSNIIRHGLTLQEVMEYFKKNDLEAGFYGWKIRRIDDIHGINVRFAMVTDTRGYAL